MSILQQVPSANINKYCGKHPQETVVGVCGACLSHKLSSLIHTPTPPSPPPQNVEPLSHLVGSSHSPPILLNSAPPHHHPLPHQDHLLTINEEADSSTQEIVTNEGLPCSNLEELPSVVDVCAAAMDTGNDLAHLSIRVDVPSINEEKPLVNQEISFISEVRPVINEEVPVFNQEESAIEEGICTTSRQIRGNKSAKCRRSKSLSVLGREGLNDILRAGHGRQLAAKSLVERRTGEQGSLGVNKVTLRALFEIENEEKRRDRELAAHTTTDIQLGARDDQFSENDKPNEEELHDNSIGDSLQTEAVAKDVRCETSPDNNTHNTHGCVPSASTLSASVCPSVPDKLKNSVLLNSLLCRKAKDEKGGVIKRKASQVHEANRHNNIFIKNFNEEGFAGASDEGGLIRATYIPTESRVITSCRRKIERCIAKSSASSSQPSSPARISHVFDSKSERKFNLSARALAVEVPSAILRSSAEAADTCKIVGSLRSDEGQETGPPPMSTDSDTVAEARPVIPLVLTAEEEQRLAESIASLARKAKGQKAMGNTPISRKRKEQVDEEHGEMTDSPPPPTPDISVEIPAHNLPSTSQPSSAADMMMLTIPSTSTIDLEEEHERDALAGTVQVQDTEGRNAVGNPPIPECRNARDNQPECEDTMENRQSLELRDATENQPIPSYITATESLQLGGQEAYAVYGRSLSCKASSGKAAKQSSQEGVWEPYSSKSSKAAGLFGRSSSRHYKWSSSSRTVKIAPDQTGLLRFYLTPLRASGRTRFLSPRRPPKRRLWSFLSKGAH